MEGTDTELSWELASIMEFSSLLHDGESCTESYIEPSLSPDQQEALSVRYAQGIWVVPLSSGNWALFGVDRKLLAIVAELNSRQLRELDFMQGQQWNEAQIARTAAGRAPIIARTAASAEDLGL